MHTSMCARVCSYTICMMCVLPWTCNMAEASVLPTLFSDVQVYVPSSRSFTRSNLRLLPLWISNLGKRKEWDNKTSKIYREAAKMTILIHTKRRKHASGADKAISSLVNQPTNHVLRGSGDVIFNWGDTVSYLLLILLVNPGTFSYQLEINLSALCRKTTFLSPDSRLNIKINIRGDSPQKAKAFMKGTQWTLSNNNQFISWSHT